MGIDPRWESMATKVISRLADVAKKLSAIVKIRKYKGFLKGHHFTLMAMKVHGAPMCDMDHFIRECAHLFNDRQSRGHLSLFFCI